MSGLSDLASWALGGGAGRGARTNDGDTNNEGANNDSGGGNGPVPISEEEMRARRMARLAALEKRGDTEAAGKKSDDPSSMEIDPPVPSKTSPVKGDEVQAMDLDDKDCHPAAAAAVVTKQKPVLLATNSSAEPAPKKQAKAAKLPPADPAADAARKIRRKKALLLRRVLLVTVGSDPSDRNASCVHVAMNDDGGAAGDSSGIAVHNVAEILANRLDMSPCSKELQTVPHQKPGLISYLAGSHRRSIEEWKELRQSMEKKKVGVAGEEELREILEEIRKQVVSYAASALMVPDLFELGSDSSLQLAKCLASTATDPLGSITFDALGKNSSFYYSLCEELISQGDEAFETVIGDVTSHLTQSLTKCETIMDEGATPSDGGVGGNGLLLTSALRELCSHKKAAGCLTRTSSFLLPPPDSPAANTKVTPPVPQLPAGSTPQQARLFQMMQVMSGNRAGYLRRSGPGLEKETVLGLVLRLGLPSEHPSVSSAFSNAASRTKKDVNQSIDGMRRQLELYQSKCNELIHKLVVAGAGPRQQVIKWFIDALLVNVNAGATRPDKTKVSGPELLLNLSVVLLNLCSPFVNDPKKALLVDPGFISSPNDHGGIYNLTGDDSLARLGENMSQSGVEYDPKNRFIPLCFFFCSRSLALSIIPETNYYDMVVYQARRIAWTLQRQNDSLRSDPNLNRYLSLQYAKEIHLQSSSYIPDVLRFYDMLAGFLLRLKKEELTTMPEHVVDDLCEVLKFASNDAPNLMAGIDFGNSFRLVVTLLSQDYSHLVRNYNLRAKLGDVLHDIFLPGKSDNRSSVPDSVTCDPRTGGQPFLTSDKLSQETLAPSLLLLYGEVEHTGFYEKNTHRTKIAELLKFLWESPEHKQAFKRITEDKVSFIKFANGVVNEMNHQFANVMERLPSIRTVQLQMANAQGWAALSEEERETITSRHEENEQVVKRDLPLCNSVMKMLGFLNTDKDIRDMFLLPEMCSRLANMLLHVLSNLVGGKGLDLKVDNPETYNFRPKEMLRDLCAVFSSFAAADEFQKECAESGYYTPELMDKSVKTCRKLVLLVGESMDLFDLLAVKIEEALKVKGDDDALYQDAPDEFLDPLMCTFMKDPVLLPTSGKTVDRQTIMQHLLNDAKDPFNRKDLCVDDILPAVDLKEKMNSWLNEKRVKRARKKN